MTDTAKRALAVVAVVLAAITPGCGRGHDTQALSVAKPTCPNDLGEGPTGGPIILNRVAQPPTLDAMKAEADVVVRATGTPTTCMVMNIDMPTNVRIVEVLEVLKGDGVHVGDAIEVRQTGTPRTMARDTPPYLAAGAEYVLYLDGDTSPDGVTAYYPVAVGGVFGVKDGVVTHLDPLSTLSDVEKRLPLAEWRAKVTASS